MSTLTLPNLVIAGVTKAGTSSLFWYLAQHPEICPADTPQVNHFAPVRYGEEPSGALDAYASHWRHWRGERYRLDKSPTYFPGGTRVATQLADTVPDARVVVILRDPVARMWSSYRYKKSRGRLGREVDFDAFFSACYEKRESGEDETPAGALYQTLSVGCYAPLLQQWFAVFNERLRVVFFEHLSGEPRAETACLLRWLELEDSIARDFVYEVRNRTLKPRSQSVDGFARAANKRLQPLLSSAPSVKAALRSMYRRANDGAGETMTFEQRARAASFYAERNAELARLLAGRGYVRLPEWLGSIDAGGRRETSR